MFCLFWADNGGSFWSSTARPPSILIKTATHSRTTVLRSANIGKETFRYSNVHPRTRLVQPVFGRVLDIQIALRFHLVFLFPEMREVSGGGDHGGVVEIVSEIGNKKVQPDFLRGFLQLAAKIF